MMNRHVALGVTASDPWRALAQVAADLDRGGGTIDAARHALDRAAEALPAMSPDAPDAVFGFPRYAVGSFIAALRRALSTEPETPSPNSERDAVAISVRRGCDRKGVTP